jgi:hypothetical protein
LDTRVSKNKALPSATRCGVLSAKAEVAGKGLNKALALSNKALSPSAAPKGKVAANKPEARTMNKALRNKEDCFM